MCFYGPNYAPLYSCFFCSITRECFGQLININEDMHTFKAFSSKPQSVARSHQLGQDVKTTEHLRDLRPQPKKATDYRGRAKWSPVHPNFAKPGPLRARGPHQEEDGSTEITYTGSTPEVQEVNQRKLLLVSLLCPSFLCLVHNNTYPHNEHPTHNSLIASIPRQIKIVLQAK
jgi:hypothetical protein